MLVRILAVLMSLLMHGLIAVAIWPRLVEERAEVLDLGKGPDIILTPQGMVMSEVTNLGNDIQTIETQDVVPVEQREPTPVTPAVIPREHLHDAVGDIENKKPPDAVAVQEQKPAPEHPTSTPAEQLPNVISSEKSTIEQEIVNAAKPPQDQIKQPKVVAADERPAMDALQEPQVVKANEAPSPKKLDEPNVANANEPAAPTQPNETRVSKADLPPPDELKEPKVANANEPAAPPQPSETRIAKADLPLPNQLKEPNVAEADEPSPTEPLDEQKPYIKEVQAVPEQVAIVMEESAGEAKTGGDARLIGIYLGRINDKVQHSKVNPHSRQTGRVLLKFTIGTNGSLLSKQIASSSGSHVLDDAALAAIDRAAPFPAIPRDVSAQPMTFTQQFRFIVR